MARERDRITEVVKYLESEGIEVNIAKNKARGNKGFFLTKAGVSRIDVAKDLTEENILKVLSHEFAHYIHYSYDKSLSSLSFIFEDITQDEMDELLELTVQSISRKNIIPFFELKNSLKDEILQLSSKIKSNYPDFLPSKANKEIEKKILKTPYKHLLKYDRVKVFDCFKFNIYSVDSLKEDSIENLYIKLKSKQRGLRRVNSKISRLNRYYNSPTELFARAFEFYVSDKELFIKKAPLIYSKLKKALISNKIPALSKFYSIIKSI